MIHSVEEGRVKTGSIELVSVCVCVVAWWCVMVMGLFVTLGGVLRRHKYVKLAPGLTGVEPGGAHAIVQLVPAEIIPLLTGQSPETMFSG